MNGVAFSSSRILGLALGSATWFSLALGCGSDVTSPSGPPLVRQVFVAESVVGADEIERELLGLAFGDHPRISQDTDDRTVDEAVALPNRPIRVVMSELLVGNHLEEMLCTDMTFSRVELGADPDDVRDCSPANVISNAPDAPQCTAVCSANGGFFDELMDGSPDTFRMISVAEDTLVVQLICDGVNIPLDPLNSFSLNTGSQQLPETEEGIELLGPALVLQPLDGIRTDSECTIAFDSTVVDKDGNQPCAPPAGDVRQSCEPGDTSAVSFRTEVMALELSVPADGEMDVEIGDGAKDLSLLFNAKVAPETMNTAFQLVEDPGGLGVDRTADLVVAVGADGVDVTLTVTGGLVAGTAYQLVVTDGLTDRFGAAFPEAVTITFTTTAAVL